MNKWLKIFLGIAGFWSALVGLMYLYTVSPLLYVLTAFLLLSGVLAMFGLLVVEED